MNGNPRKERSDGGFISTVREVRGAMKQGFVVDNNYGTRGVSHWAPGAPAESFWTGTKVSEKLIPIGTFRCASCGYLESYARDEFAAR